MNFILFTVTQVEKTVLGSGDVLTCKINPKITS